MEQRKKTQQRQQDEHRQKTELLQVMFELTDGWYVVQLWSTIKNTVALKTNIQPVLLILDILKSEKYLLLTAGDGPTHQRPEAGGERTGVKDHWHREYPGADAERERPLGGATDE